MKSKGITGTSGSPPQNLRTGLITKSNTFSTPLKDAGEAIPLRLLTVSTVVQII